MSLGGPDTGGDYAGPAWKMGVDLPAIRERAVNVVEAMIQDCGPVTAEPYSTWAIEEARDVLALLYVIDTEGGAS